VKHRTKWVAMCKRQPRSKRTAVDHRTLQRVDRDGVRLPYQLGVFPQPSSPLSGLDRGSVLRQRLFCVKASSAAAWVRTCFLLKLVVMDSTLANPNRGARRV